MKVIAVFALATIAALALCLVGCSNSPSSSQPANFTESVKELNWDELLQAYKDNPSATKNEWSMEKVRCTATANNISIGYDGSITADCNNINTQNEPLGMLSISLSKSDADKVHQGDSITVEGILSFDNSSCVISDTVLLQVNGKDAK